MKNLAILLFPIAGLLVGCAPKPVPVPAPPPPPPVVVEPKLEASLLSRPGPAEVALKGQSLGQTPRTVKVASLDEVFQITAAQDQEKPTETRIRVLSDTSAEVTFVFGPSASPMARALGLPRILVFDYGSALTFATDKWDLAPAFTAMLDHQAELLASHFAGIQVFVCGHTDLTGKANHNAVLAFRRAEVVSYYLTLKGVNKSLIKTQGFGSAYPVATNDTPAGRALNRRTEIILPQ
jgi:outer membrane protein OmpA-like peptidoglycan-associated protein